LYRPKKVVLVIVTPQNAGFVYHVGHMPHKIINPKPKNFKENKKKQRNQKNQSPGGNLWAQHFSQDFGFFGFFVFFFRPCSR